MYLADRPSRLITVLAGLLCKPVSSIGYLHNVDVSVAFCGKMVDNFPHYTGYYKPY